MSDFEGAARLEKIFRNKFRTSVMGVFLADTVNACRYKLSDAETKTVSFENDSPVFPPCEVNLKIKGQKNLLKNLFRYMLENTDFTNCTASNIFIAVIVPEWGKWKTDEVKKITAAAADEAVKEIEIDNPDSQVNRFRFLVDVDNRISFIREYMNLNNSAGDTDDSDFSNPDVIAEISEKKFRFYPSDESGLESVETEANMSMLAPAVQNYLSQNLSVFAIAENNTVKALINRIKPSVNITATTRSDIAEDLFDCWRRENESLIKYEMSCNINSCLFRLFPNEKLIESRSLVSVARECEQKFTELLLMKPDGWTDGIDITEQSFFTVFFDKVFIESLKKINELYNDVTNFISKITTKIFFPSFRDSLSEGISNAVNEVSSELFNIIYKAADTVYNDSIILQAVKCVDETVNKITETYSKEPSDCDLTAVFDCEATREALKNGFKDLFNQILRFTESEQFKLSPKNIEKYKTNEIYDWLVGGRTDKAGIYEDMKNYFEEEIKLTFSEFSEAIVNEYLKYYEGGKYYEQDS